MSLLRAIHTSQFAQRRGNSLEVACGIKTEKSPAKHLCILLARPSSRNPAPSINLGYDAPVKEGRGILKRRLVENTTNAVERRKIPSDMYKEVRASDLHVHLDYNENMSAKHSHSDCASQTDINALSSSSMATQWTDLSLQDYSYTDVDHLSLSKEKSTQTNTKCFEEKGVNCNTLHVLMSYDDITTDSKSLLYTGLSLTAFQTVD